MYKGGSVFVAGSAHLDVLATATGAEAVIDKMGHVTIEIGGTACNIATNLAALGLKPRMLTAMQEKSPYSGIIAGHLRAHGVDLHAVNHVDKHAAVFSAHVGSDGEMISAVSCMPVETAVFPEITVRAVMKGAACAILECNLSRRALNELAKIAHELRLPVFVACVSEEKSLRVTAIEHPIAGIFMSRRESLYLSRNLCASTSPRAIEKHLRCPIIINCDQDGVTVIELGVETHILPIDVMDKVHTMGAGDALLAATVAHHIYGGMGLTDSVEKAVSFVARVIGNPTCSAGQGHAIEEALINLERMSTRDSMTGLVNRREGEQIMTRAHDYALHLQTPYAVLMVDIDHFKRVNDTHGHNIGDEAIKAVSSILLRTVRDVDIACRWGGEEFLCILKGADLPTAAIVAERIRAAVERAAIAVVGKITVSIGAAAWNVDASNPACLIQTADEGLYEAKRMGRNKVAIAALTRLEPTTLGV